MLKKIMMATLAVGALALNAPAAVAAEPEYDCSFDASRQEDVTGQNYEGAIFGFVADSDGDAVSIRCYITVNGAEVGAEASGSGTGAAVAAGPISFAATPADDVDICADINGSFAECFQGEHSQIPPQEVIDAINGVLTIVNDFIAENTKALDKPTCDALKLAGAPALVNSLTATTGISMDAEPGNDDCDLWDETTDPRSRIIDFDPYED